MTASFFVLNMFNALAIVYGASRLCDVKINFKNKKIYIVLIILSACMYIAYFLTKSAIKLIFLLQIYNICNVYLFCSEENKINKITLVSMLSTGLHRQV